MNPKQHAFDHSAIETFTWNQTWGGKLHWNLLDQRRRQNPDHGQPKSPSEHPDKLRITTQGFGRITAIATDLEHEIVRGMAGSS